MKNETWRDNIRRGEEQSMFAIYFNSPALRNQPVSYLSVLGTYVPYLYGTAEVAQVKCDELNAIRKAWSANRIYSYEVRKYKR